MKDTSQLTRKEKDAHVEAWEASGLTQKAYSRQFNLNYSTFKNWVRHYRIRQADHPLTASEVDESSFLPVTFKAEEPTRTGTAELMITYPNGVKVSCSGINTGQILQLIKHY